jgi:hypothetical protein
VRIELCQRPLFLYMLPVISCITSLFSGCASLPLLSRPLTNPGTVPLTGQRERVQPSTTKLVAKHGTLNNLTIDGLQLLICIHITSDSKSKADGLSDASTLGNLLHGLGDSFHPSYSPTSAG